MKPATKRNIAAALILVYVAVVVVQTYFIVLLSAVPTAQSSASGSVQVNVIETPQPSVGPVCGNGVKEGSEECDDGNTRNGDGCSSTCRTEPPLPSILPPQPPPLPSIICFDSVKNGDETDVDCGGRFCKRCAVEETCIVNPDCETDYCRIGICSVPEIPAIAVPAPIIITVPALILEAMFRFFQLVFQFLLSLFG